METKRYLILFAVVASLLLAGCTGGGSGEDGSTGTNFQLSVSSPETNMDLMEINLKGAEVIRDESGGTTSEKISLSKDSIDLADMEGEEVIGTGSLPEGRYDRVRLKVSVSNSRKEGDQIEVLVPDNTVEVGSPLNIEGSQVNYLIELKVLRVGPTAAYTLVPVKDNSGAK